MTGNGKWKLFDLRRAIDKTSHPDIGSAIRGIQNLSLLPKERWQMEQNDMAGYVEANLARDESWVIDSNGS